MFEVNDNLKTSVKSVFSILPSKSAKEAESELLKRYWNRTTRDSSLNIKWLEYDPSTSQIRAGRSELEQPSTYIYRSPFENTEIKTLYEKIKLRDYKIGQIEKAPNQEKFFWFLSYAEVQNELHSKQPIKGLIINEAVFFYVLDNFNPTAKLTKAEKRVIFQLTYGDSLLQAAIKDNVSIETKRSQLKVASQKMDCNGQTDLVRIALGQLTHLVSITSSELAQTQSTDIPEFYAHEYLQKDVTFRYQRLPNGRILRFFECGPSDGRPLIVIHGMLFTLLLNKSSDYLKKIHVRMIMPIRHGFLENSSTIELYEADYRLNQWVDDIAVYLKGSFSRPVALMGYSFGSVIAIRLAGLFPNLFSHLICASVSFAKPHSSSSKYSHQFYSGLNQLLSKPGIFRLISWQFRKYYADEKTARSILRGIFEECESDINILDERIGEKPQYYWFKDGYKTSIVGVAEDFSFAMNNENYPLAKVPISTTFIQGEDDPMTSKEALLELTEQSPHCKVIYIPNSGHFVYSSKPTLFWQNISSAISERK
jgi:pimeloyl-ACP methyl ester carboxylesterase/DNA-binding CsgD family transcriptional regulator